MAQLSLDPPPLSAGPAISPHQARVIAAALRARAGGLDALGAALFDAQVDLNPHQIEAALVGVQASAERGRLLADEVGLGKTIEAGLVLCQRWAERRRRLLVICPAALRRQWAAELRDKFGLLAVLLDGKDGEGNPFDRSGVLICSPQYAAARADRLSVVGWDLVIIDEAHRLRNAWRGESRMGRPLLNALDSAPKLLLTATPLQNSLIELFGVMRIIDQRAFGDPAAFRARFDKKPDMAELRARLAGTCHRTLRKDVLPYIRYTARKPLTYRFRSSDAEQELNLAVSALLDRDDVRCLPVRQRELLRMLLRKLLASSSRAIAGALRTLRDRVAAAGGGPVEVGGDDLTTAVLGPDEPVPVPTDFDDEDGLVDGAAAGGADSAPGDPAPLGLAQELELLDALIARAEGVGTDKRAEALLGALQQGFTELRKLGAPAKAVIFTESRRTQDWLAAHLQAHGYSGQVVCFNGTNQDPAARAALRDWTARNPGLAAQGSRAVNVRAALVDQFRREGAIFLTTEAGAEGLNLQFCSMIVNYDLPWNPQRVEQRIGRCHRYGQRHDVVVVNFLDKANEADQRVYELLDEKCRLFDGVFGASDSVLGAILSGAGLERKIHRIFRECRSPDAISAAFSALRATLDDEIQEREAKARDVLFSSFDVDVHDRLQLGKQAATAQLSRITRQLSALAGYALRDHASFASGGLRFTLQTSPVEGAPEGAWALVPHGERADAAAGQDHLLRFNHPLGEYVLQRAADAPAPPALLRLSLRRSGLRISALDGLAARRGALIVQRLQISGLTDEEHVLIAAVTDDGLMLEPDAASRLIELPGEVIGPLPSWAPLPQAAAALEHLRATATAAAAARDAVAHRESAERIDRWAADQLKGVEATLAELRLLIAAKEKEAKAAPSLAEARARQAELAGLEDRRHAARRRSFHIEDELRDKRRALLAELDARLAARRAEEPICTVAWTLEDPA